MSADLSLSPLSPLDLKAMLEIEQQAHSHPWSRALLASNFGGLYVNTGLFSESGLVAYSIVRCVAGEAELLNVAVEPTFQGQGLGSMLMQNLMQQAEQQAWSQLMLEVRASNHAAQALYQRFGLQQIDCRKAYYPSEQGREDALIMQRTFS